MEKILTHSDMEYTRYNWQYNHVDYFCLNFYKLTPEISESCFLTTRFFTKTQHSVRYSRYLIVISSIPEDLFHTLWWSTSYVHRIEIKLDFQFGIFHRLLMKYILWIIQNKADPSLQSSFLNKKYGSWPDKTNIIYIV